MIEILIALTVILPHSESIEEEEEEHLRIPI
jgi:hypothetical protein